MTQKLIFVNQRVRPITVLLIAAKWNDLVAPSLCTGEADNDDNFMKPRVLHMKVYDTCVCLVVNLASQWMLPGRVYDKGKT